MPRLEIVSLMGALSGAALALGACNGPSYDAAETSPAPTPSLPSTPARVDAGPGPGDAGDAPPADDPGTMGGDGTEPGYDSIEAAEEETLSAEWRAALAAREVDYSAALRLAALRLTGEPPALLDVRFVASAGDPRAAYEAVLDRYLEDVRFARQMRSYFRDTFKMGGSAALDTAPVFAAELVVEDRDFTELFTASSGNCPTWDSDTGAFTPADCESDAPAESGVLTNPAVMKHFDSNLAFRRVRWVQETFDCTRFPAEVTGSLDVGGPSPYTSPWPFESIAGAVTGGHVDFRDVSSVVCANCHSTINHIAPLFAHFDHDGMWQSELVATLPSDGNPAVELGDYLPPGEHTSWRFGVPAADLPALGRAMAADPAVTTCSVARMWDFAMGKGDIVTTLAVVPESVIHDLVVAHVTSGHRMKDTLRTIFTSDDFVRF